MSGRFLKGMCAGVVGLSLAVAAPPVEAGGYSHYHSGGDAWAYGLAGGLLGLGLGIALATPRPVYAPPPAYAPPPPSSYGPSASYAAPTYYETSAFVTTSSVARTALYAEPVQAGVIDAEPTSPIYRSSSGASCREFRGTGVVGGVKRPVVGTACQGADGEWRVVR